MIVNYLHLINIASFPDKAYSPPVVDPDGKLTCPISLKGLQAIARRDS
jgi:hypothetical protein